MAPLTSLLPLLQSTLDDAVEANGVPGAVVGVRKGEEEILAAAGLANVATGVTTTTDTLFQVGSISTIYTATLVMQLVHAGLVALDEPVRAVLQEFRVRDDLATLEITPRHLLSHTSGIDGDHLIDCGRNPDALWRYVSTLDEVGQVHPPDDMYSFCNTGFGVLGRLVEESTGDHFTRALERRLLRPLELRRTFSQTDEAIVHRVAAGHHQIRGEEPEVRPWTLARFNVPIGGLIASATDVLTFAAMHLNGGTSTSGKQVLASRVVAEMQQGQVEVPGTTDERGLGWLLEHWDGADVIGHDGNTAGQRAFLRAFPGLDTAVVVLTNSPLGDHVADACLRFVAGELLDVRRPDLPEPSGDGPDPESYTGIYERMHLRLALAGGEDGTLRLTIIPDELLLRAGQRERTLTLRAVDHQRFVTIDPLTGVAELVVTVGDEAGRPDYVYFSDRAHRRIS